MRKVIFFLAELTDQDLDWISGAGTVERIRSGQVLVKQGKPSPALYLILSGKFNVSNSVGALINESGPGEVIGEISFLDSRPPSATVTAAENSTVLAVSSQQLRGKMRTDLGFASRFYRGLGVMLAHRLRDVSARQESGAQRKLDDADEESGEFAPELFEKLNLAAVRFQKLSAMAAGG